MLETIHKQSEFIEGGLEKVHIEVYLPPIALYPGYSHARGSCSLCAHGCKLTWNSRDFPSLASYMFFWKHLAQEIRILQNSIVEAYSIAHDIVQFSNRNSLSKLIGSASPDWCWTRSGHSVAIPYPVVYLVPAMLLLRKVMKLRMCVLALCMCSFQTWITACRVHWQCYTVRQETSNSAAILSCGLHVFVPATLLLREVIKLHMHVHAQSSGFARSWNTNNVTRQQFCCKEWSDRLCMHSRE